MADIKLTVTDAGWAALINAQNTGTAAVTISHCGVSASALVPTLAVTALPGEIKRIATLSGAAVADDTIHITVRDESADNYTLRSLAFYLNDGTLFALYGQATPIMEKSGLAMLMLAVDAHFLGVDVSSVTFGDTNFLNPPATTERQGVVELSTDAEAALGEDPIRGVTPKSMKRAVTTWLDDRFGALSPSAFVKDLLSITTAALFRKEIGLDRVDNTSDIAKPISTATQAAINVKAASERKIIAGAGLTGGGDLKADRTLTLGTPGTISQTSQNNVTETGHTHALNITKSDIGLGNVDNTSDANKPISTAAANALSGKVDKTSPARPGVTRLYRRDDNNDFSVQVNWDGARWFLRGYSAGDAFHGECRVGYADFAGGVAWGNVSGRPTALSSFTNNMGYITTDGRAYGRKADGDPWNLIWSGQGTAPGWVVGSNNGIDFYAYAPSLLSVNYANSAGAVAWTNVTDRPTALSSFTNNMGFINTDGRAFPRRSNDGAAINFNWHDNGIQPQYLWGGDDGINMRVYAIRSMHVRYADSAGNADTVDGYHADAFAKYADFTSGSNANGYWRRGPDGMLEQWGVVTGDFAEGAIIRNFPTPFTDVDSISVQVTCLNTYVNPTSNDMWTQMRTVSLTQFTAVFQATSSGNRGAGFHFYARGR